MWKSVPRFGTMYVGKDCPAKFRKSRRIRPYIRGGNSRVTLLHTTVRADPDRKTSPLFHSAIFPPQPKDDETLPKSEVPLKTRKAKKVHCLRAPERTKDDDSKQNRNPPRDEDTPYNCGPVLTLFSTTKKENLACARLSSHKTV